MQLSPGLGTGAPVPPSATSSAAFAPGEGRDVAASRTVHALFETHATELRRYAQRIVRTRDAAEDVVQEVFLRLWLVRDRVEFGADTRAYLYITTRARALNALGRARSEARRRDDLPVDDAGAVDEVETPGGPREGAPVPSGAAIAHAVEQVLASMPPRQRAVATLRLRHHRSTAEIARELGISPRTVEAHVARATRRLRERLPTLIAVVACAAQ